jgi:hypothetical protein
LDPIALKKFSNFLRRKNEKDGTFGGFICGNILGGMCRSRIDGK